jgi:hypothetical protein
VIKLFDLKNFTTTTAIMAGDPMFPEDQHVIAPTSVYNYWKGMLQQYTHTKIKLPAEL